MKSVTPFWKRVRYYVPLATSLILIALLAITVVKIVQSKPDFTAALITNDLKKIKRVLYTIDQECDILSFDSDYTLVNFLTVIAFKGSEVGGLNLGRPGNWRGPYLDQDPEVQGKNYQIVKARDGLYVIPGDGVKLPTGGIMGKDVIITHQTRVSTLTKKGGPLYYRGQNLAVCLTMTIGDWQGCKIVPEKIEHRNKIMQEFNKAMPYTSNQSHTSDKSRFASYTICLPRSVG